MKVNDTYYINGSNTLTITATSQRRFVSIPLLLAIGLGTKASAEQILNFNGVEVAKVKALMGGVSCIGWTGYIEANQSATIELIDKRNGGDTPRGITVLVGDA